MRGLPVTAVSDNSTELTSVAILRWSQERGVSWHYIAPGKPTRELCAELGADVAALDTRIAGIDRRLAARHKNNPVSQLLTTIPGVGPVAALTFAITVDPARFTSGRAFAAFLGLTPKDHSSGGKQRLGGISRDERLRELLVLGATSVLSHAVRGKGGRGASRWLLQLLGREPRKLAAVALANKMARIIWALLNKGGIYHRPEPLSIAAVAR